MQLIATDRIKKKIRELHNVTLAEVEEAWFLHDGHYLEDAEGEDFSLPDVQIDKAFIEAMNNAEFSDKIDLD